MCGCKDKVRASIAWANTAAATYASCDKPANTSGRDVEACFKAAQPGATVVASTDSSGSIKLPPASADPCQRIEDKSSRVHETMHARHADDMARAQGSAFLKAWTALAGDPKRLDKLRVTFPKEVAAFEAQWNNGSDWAKDEVHSYTSERRFLEDTLAALNRIC
jgi:predicted secreted Zn-dependent protease